MSPTSGAGVGKIRLELQLDKLSSYLADKVPNLQLPLEALQFTHGQSNPTFMLKDAKLVSFFTVLLAM